jgi:hypothetical protein
MTDRTAYARGAASGRTSIAGGTGLDKSQNKKIRKYYFLELQDVPQSRDGNTSRRRRLEV